MKSKRRQTYSSIYETPRAIMKLKNIKERSPRRPEVSFSNISQTYRKAREERERVKIRYNLKKKTNTI